MTWKKNDEGSGTLLGICMVILVGCMGLTILCAGSFLIAKSRSRTLAEEFSLDLAYEIQLNALEGSNNSASSVCSSLYQKKIENNFRVASCVVEGQEVQIAVEGIPHIRFLPHTISVSRAGPAECVPRNR